MEVPSAQPASLEKLRREIARFERQPCSTGVLTGDGCRLLDRLLPRRGISQGSLVEWLAAGEGTGIERVAMVCAAEISGGAVVVVDPRHEFYPPEAMRLGLGLDRLVLVHPANHGDHLWAIDQAMRCPGVAAVLAWPDAFRRPDDRTFRRLQLAAGKSGAIGFLLRDAAVRSAPSWANVRWLVEPLPSARPESHRRQLRIHLLRCRGGVGDQDIPYSTDVELNDETHTLHLAAELAGPATAGCPSGI